jgi:hypothetical protein
LKGYHSISLVSSTAKFSGTLQNSSLAHRIPILSYAPLGEFYWVSCAEPLHRLIIFSATPIGLQDYQLSALEQENRNPAVDIPV